MKTKKCTKCGEVKLLEHFSPNANRLDGRVSICKECSKINARKFRRTKHGVTSVIYNDQVNHRKTRKQQLPTYTKDELRNWLFNHPDFDKLYNNWVESGYDKWLKPSVDRLDDYKGYSFDNIQLVTWIENWEKWKYNSLNGVNNKNSRTILQYDLDGNFIKEYYSAKQAERETGSNSKLICSVCSGKRNHTNNFIWKYKNEDN